MNGFLYEINDIVRIKYFNEKKDNKLNVSYIIKNKETFKDHTHIYIIENNNIELHIDEIYLEYDPIYLRKMKLKSIIK